MTKTDNLGVGLQLDNDVLITDRMHHDGKFVVVLHQSGNLDPEITMLPSEAEAIALQLIRFAAIARIKNGIPGATALGTFGRTAALNGTPIAGREVRKTDRRAKPRRISDKSRRSKS